MSDRPAVSSFPKEAVVASLTLPTHGRPSLEQSTARPNLDMIFGVAPEVPEGDETLGAVATAVERQKQAWEKIAAEHRQRMSSNGGVDSRDRILLPFAADWFPFSRQGGAGAPPGRL